MTMYCAGGSCVRWNAPALHRRPICSASSTALGITAAATATTNQPSTSCLPTMSPVTTRRLLPRRRCCRSGVAATAKNSFMSAIAAVQSPDFLPTSSHRCNKRFLFRSRFLRFLTFFYFFHVFYLKNVVKSKV